MTYRLPSLNALRAFEAAARHLSFKVAANELGVTAGAVSQQVKKLEASLGVSLFRRLPNGLLLTRQGENYLPKITQIFETLTEATEAIAPDMNGKKFTVGVCPEALDLLEPNWPHHSEALKAHVRDRVSTNDVDLVRKDEIDCLIRRGGGPYGDLSLQIVSPSSAGEAQGTSLHVICKPGLANCRQTQALLEDLHRQFGAAPV